jgi:hypothetical protein
VLLGGDLTNYGVVEEAKVLVEELAPLKNMPVFAVLGNHDVESNQQDELVKIFRDAGVTMLDGDAVVVHGVGIAGVKGFCGGFGRRALEPWGESTIKQFVRDSIDESLKLESALARLRDEPRVADRRQVHPADALERVAAAERELLGQARLAAAAGAGEGEQSRRQQQLREIWAALAMTVLFVTHSISEAVFLANRIIVLSPRPTRILLDSSIQLTETRTAALRTSFAYVEEVRRIATAVPAPEPDT